jgi:hypothetical protein
MGNRERGVLSLRKFIIYLQLQSMGMDVVTRQQCVISKVRLVCFTSSTL